MREESKKSEMVNTGLDAVESVFRMYSSAFLGEKPGQTGARLLNEDVELLELKKQMRFEEVPVVDFISSLIARTKNGGYKKEFQRNAELFLNRAYQLMREQALEALKEADIVPFPAAGTDTEADPQNR